NALPRSLLPVLGLAAFAGCSTRHIRNTQIEDIEENRAILQVIEQYRRAVVDSDAPSNLDLTRARTFEHPSTPGDPRDDYDKAGLRTKLEESFSRVQDQDLRIDVRKLHQLDDDKAAVEYRFHLRYRLALPSAEGWREFIDVNRVVLVRE